MNTYRMGIDIGSTTAKVVILDGESQIAYSDYRRHHAETLGTLLDILKDALQALGEIDLDLLMLWVVQWLLFFERVLVRYG